MSLSPPSTEFHQRHSRRNSPSHGGHDVFISSTQTTLTSHLVDYLHIAGINPYCHQIEAGGEEKQIRENLRRAIDESTVYVVVFSDDFADSEASLWELETIVEAAEKGGKRILAIFYGVTRDDVRLGTDLYGEKLGKHNAGESTVQRWVECLRYVADDQNDDGFSLTANTTNGDDADLCLQTLERVRQLIGPKEPSVDLQLNLRGLPNFVSTQSLEEFLASSKSLCIEDCGTLYDLFTLPGRKQLEELKVRRCHMLTEIPGLGEFESLKVLILEDCMFLRKLPNLSKLVLLEELYISFCPCLTEVLGLSSLESLVRMEISNCENLDYVDINLLKLNKLESLILKDCGNLRRLGDDGSSFQNLQSSPSSQQQIINIHDRTLLGRGEPNDWDNDDENFQLSETSATPTQSAFVLATDHHALGRSCHHPVFCTGSSSTTANTNELEIFKDRCCDDSCTNIELASRSVDVYPYWYPDSDATNHLTNNTCTMIDSTPYHGTGKAIVDHEEYRAEHTKEQQETFEELDSTWIFIDSMQNYPSKEEAAQGNQE